MGCSNGAYALGAAVPAADASTVATATAVPAAVSNARTVSGSAGVRRAGARVGTWSGHGWDGAARQPVPLIERTLYGSVAAIAATEPYKLT